MEDKKLTNLPLRPPAPVNYAEGKPKKMKLGDRVYIDNKLKRTFLDGHARRVHVEHLGLAQATAEANARRKKGGW